MECEFLNPVDFQGNVPASSTDFWNFENLICTSSTSTLPIYISEVISTSTPEKNFFLSNTIDLGQILLLGFGLFVFLLVAVISIKNEIFKN
jgi:hypothetical protein